MPFPSSILPVACAIRDRTRVAPSCGLSSRLASVMVLYDLLSRCTNVAIEGSGAWSLIRPGRQGSADRSNAGCLGINQASQFHV